MFRFILGILYLVYNSNFCLPLLPSLLWFPSSGKCYFASTLTATWFWQRLPPALSYLPQALFVFVWWRENSAHYEAIEIVWMLSAQESVHLWEVRLSSPCRLQTTLAKQRMPTNHQPSSFPLGAAPNENHTPGNERLYCLWWAADETMLAFIKYHKQMT